MPTTFTRFMPAGPLDGPQGALNDPAIQLALPTVNRFFRSVTEQHEARRWEYALALEAAEAWRKLRSMPRDENRGALQCLDVGGAGSPFSRMLDAFEWDPRLVDQEATEFTWPNFARQDIEHYAQRLGPHVDAIFSISVLEHVPGVPHFLAACDRVLRPGGLLFLTVDAWDPTAEQVALDAKPHFHWMRQRCYTPMLLHATVDFLYRGGYRLLLAPGEPAVEKHLLDMIWKPYPGPAVYDYSFASIAVVKPTDQERAAQDAVADRK